MGAIVINENEDEIVLAVSHIASIGKIRSANYAKSPGDAEMEIALSGGQTVKAQGPAGALQAKRAAIISAIEALSG